eukprot:GHVS01097396.1.p1 GENE.GHVS01097396.1~~GHVS01097396.1.p1  ORF type:complete len:576 (+),score=67.56 GHVS01097396.1:119-1846(+)
MRLSRCALFGVSGLLAVGVGTATAGGEELVLGAGTVYLLDGKPCPKGIPTLSLKHSKKEVMDLYMATMRNKYVEGLEPFYKYAVNEKTAMLYDKGKNSLSVFTSEAFDRTTFTPIILQSGGEYSLDDGKEAAMLKFLSGIDVYVVNADVKAEVKKQMKIFGNVDFIMKDHTYKIISGDGGLWRSVMSLEENARGVDGTFAMDFVNNYPKARVQGVMDKETMEDIYEQIKSEPKLLYGDGCKDFALAYVKDGGEISKALAIDPDFRQLGNLADLARLRTAAQWMGGGGFAFVKDGQCPKGIPTLLLKETKQEVEDFFEAHGVTEEMRVLMKGDGLMKEYGIGSSNNEIHFSENRLTAMFYDKGTKTMSIFPAEGEFSDQFYVDVAKLDAATCRFDSSEGLGGLQFLSGLHICVEKDDVKEAVKNQMRKINLSGFTSKFVTKGGSAQIVPFEKRDKLVSLTSGYVHGDEEMYKWNVKEEFFCDEYRISTTNDDNIKQYEIQVLEAESNYDSIVRALTSLRIRLAPSVFSLGEGFQKFNIIRRYLKDSNGSVAVHAELLMYPDVQQWGRLDEKWDDGE